MGTSFFLSELLSDRLLISPVNFDFMPILMKFYGAQCSGQWSVEAIQSPEKPYAVDMMNAMLAGKWEEAHRLYNIIQPGLNDFFAMQAPCIRAGVSPWQHRKYLQWCVGGNGGLVYIADKRYQETRGKLIPTLDQKERDYIKNWYRKIGIEPYDGPDEEFMVGKAAYKRGVRAKDLAHIQWYSEK
jgi:4-hydroxy-tetrahydrodipicolinate synthase